MKRVLVAVALLACVSACSTSDAASDDSPTDSKTAAAKKAPAAKKTTAKKATVDACALLEKDDIDNVIGANDGGQHGGGVGESTCTWENQDNYHSVSLSIGEARTALGGKLPPLDAPGAGPAEDGPDGVTFQAQLARFVMDDRACSLQVVTDPTSNKDRPIEVRLIKLVRARFH